MPFLGCISAYPSPINKVGTGYGQESYQNKSPKSGIAPKEVPVEYGPGPYRPLSTYQNTQLAFPPMVVPMSNSKLKPLKQEKAISEKIPTEHESQDQGNFEAVLDVYGKIPSLALKEEDSEDLVSADNSVISEIQDSEAQPDGLSSIQKQSNQSPQPKGSIDKGYNLGLLIPLSRHHFSLGLAFLRAAEIAIFDAKNPNIKIMPLDTQGTPDGARAAVQKGIAQGVQLFLGPIFATEIQAIQGRTNGINSIAFSNDQTLAKKGTYLLAFFPKAHIIRIVDFAMESKEHKIILLAPNNKYGEILIEGFKTYMKSLKKKPHVLKYDPGQLEKLTQLVQEIQRINPNFLLIPQGNPVVDELLHQLSSQGLDLAKYKILGGDQWCISEKPTSPHAKMAVFTGPDLQMQEEFAKKYESIYGEKPPVLASLMYDAVLLSATLVDSYPKDPFSHESLTNSDGFIGLTGVFRFSEEGKAERQLEIISLG